jgi:hypothetical protein
MILPFGNINTNIANNKSFFPVREDSIRSDYTPLVLFPIGNKKHEPRRNNGTSYPNTSNFHFLHIPLNLLLKFLQQPSPSIHHLWIIFYCLSINNHRFAPTNSIQTWKQNHIDSIGLDLSQSEFTPGSLY